MNNIFGIIASIIFIGIIIATAKAFAKLGKEASRKYIHIALCNWWLIAMYFFDHPIWASIVPFCFVVINYISYKKDLIKVMEREKQDGMGTVYYAISLLILSILSFGVWKNPQIGLVAAFVMGYGDGLAAVFGNLIKSREYKIGNTIKTLAGSFVMFIITFCIIAVGIWGMNLWILKAMIASIIITIVEAVSIKGTDNITVPLATTGIYYVLLLGI